MAKKRLLLVSFLILFVICAGIVAYLFTSNMLEPDVLVPNMSYFDIKNVAFVDGGPGNDTIVATVINRSDKIFTVTGGYAAQRNWVQNGRIQQNEHPFVTELFGDLTIPRNNTGDIHLSLPRDTLVAGREYLVYLNGTNQDHGSSVGTSKRYVFYHMYHPSSSAPVEEGVIKQLSFSIIHLNYLDSILAEVQNTGDTPITIEGGFANGMAALNATDAQTRQGPCVIEPNATGAVNLSFKAESYMLTQWEGGNPFNVKLITTQGNVIDYPEKIFVAWRMNQFWVKEPIVHAEKTEISNVKFNYDSLGNGLMTLTVRNTGENMIELTGGMLNGKTLTTELLNYVIEKGSIKTITLPLLGEKPNQGSQYQLVLISSQNNAFIYSSFYR